MTREKFQIVLALGVLFVTIIACKYSYTPPGSAVDASTADVAAVADAAEDEAALAEEDPPDADQRCYTNSSQAACLRGNKAKVCASASGHGRFGGEWKVFGCPDCRARGSGVTCSDLVPGDYCSMTSARPVCTKDKLAVYTCEYPAHEWKLEACPGGCVDDKSAFGPQCNK